MSARADTHLYEEASTGGTPADDVRVGCVAQHPVQSSGQETERERAPGQPPNRSRQSDDSVQTRASSPPSRQTEERTSGF
jgi:hypothetical protein